MSNQYSGASNEYDLRPNIDTNTQGIRIVEEIILVIVRCNVGRKITLRLR